MKKLLLVFTLLLSTISLVACKSEKNTTTKINENDYNIQEDDLENEYHLDTLHDVTITENLNRVFKNSDNTTDYKIIYNGDNTIAAATFIQSNIAQATKCQIEKFQASEIDGYNSDSKYIMIGLDNYFESAGFSLEGLDLRSSGYVIKTKDSNVFIEAPQYEGYHLSALRFLDIFVGYDMISDDTVIYERSGDTIPDIDLTERPDFEYRNFTNNLSKTVQIYGQGYNGQNEIFMTLKGKNQHNCFIYLPPGEWYSTHPEWYSGAPGSSQQLCYTAHGDEESRQIMLEESYKVLKAAVEQFPHLNNITFTQEDTPTACQCEECVRCTNKYGTITSTIIRFMNDLDDMLRADIDSGNVKGRKKGDIVHIWFFAYNATIVPTDPTTAITDLDKRYVFGNKDIGCILALINVDYTKKITDPINEKYYHMFVNWGNVVDNVQTYVYECNYKNYFYPYTSFDVTVENYRFYKSINSMVMYSLGIRQNTYSTSFVSFKEYLASKAQFDVFVNYDDVKTKFFTNYFMDASDIMLKLFNEEMTWVDYLEDTNADLNGGVYELIEKPQWWPYSMLIQWESYIEKAYNEVAKYKETDPELYNRLVRHIKLEGLFPRYVLLKLYGDNYDSSELLRLRQEFRADCDYYGVTEDLEHGSISSLWSKWGLE